MLKEFIVSVISKIINMFEDDYQIIDRTYDNRCSCIPGADLIQIMRK